MALPIIEFSPTGSDTQASGAGPSNAVFGTLAKKVSANILELADNPDLSDVLTDGSHVLFVNDSTAGVVNFSTITAYMNVSSIAGCNMGIGNTISAPSDPGLVVGQRIRIPGAGAAGADLNTTVQSADGTGQITTVDSASTAVTDVTVTFFKTVQVSVDINATADRAWAIGGQRATISSTTSRKLAENNSAAGDARPGWRLRFMGGSSFSDTTASVITFRRSGDTTSGPIIIEGDPNAATKPIITGNFNGTLLATNTSVVEIVFQNLDLRNTAGTKTSTIGINIGSSGRALIRNVSINHQTNYFAQAINPAGNSIIENCNFRYQTSTAIASGNTITLRNTFIGNCTSHALTFTTNVGVFICGNIFANVGGDAIRPLAALTSSNYAPMYIGGNTFYNVTGDCIENSTSSSATGAYRGLTIENNIFHTAASGINVSGSGITTAFLQAVTWRNRNNCFWNCTNNFLPSSGIDFTVVSENNVFADPQFTDAANNDFSIGPNLKALGFQTTNIGAGDSSTRSYLDIGAAQRFEYSIFNIME